jgi:predicted nucleotidyltransferase
VPVEALPRYAEPSALAAQLAGGIPGAIASVVFGSHARGTAVEALSDIDVLLLVRDRADVRGVRDMAQALSSEDLSVIVHDEDSLSKLRAADWSFVAHLAREHVPAFGDVGKLQKLLQVPMPARRSIEREIGEHLSVPRELCSPDALGGRHLVAYSRLYGVTKSAAILDGLMAGQVSFDRSQALDQLTERRPRFRDEIELLGSLEPFWLRLRRSRHVPAPWIPRRDYEQLTRCVKAAEVLLSGLSRARE